MKKLFQNAAADIPAAVVVFLVALPLCLGVALGSNAPLFSGIIAGIVGGIVIGLLSGSPLSVSGLTANRQSEPLGLGDARPSLGWTLTRDSFRFQIRRSDRMSHRSLRHRIHHLLFGRENIDSQDSAARTRTGQTGEIYVFHFGEFARQW